MCFLHKFHFEMLYVLEWPKNRNWLALEFPDRGRWGRRSGLPQRGRPWP